MMMGRKRTSYVYRSNRVEIKRETKTKKGEGEKANSFPHEAFEVFLVLVVVAVKSVGTTDKYKWFLSCGELESRNPTLRKFNYYKPFFDSIISVVCVCTMKEKRT